MTTVWYGVTGGTLPWLLNVPNGIDYNTPPSSEALWLSMGDIEDANMDPTRDEVEVFSPSPGHYVLSENWSGFSRMKVEFTLQDMSGLFLKCSCRRRTNRQRFKWRSSLSYWLQLGIRGWFRCTQFRQQDGQNNIFTAAGRRRGYAVWE
jgi:hypothetical protein